MTLAVENRRFLFRILAVFASFCIPGSLTFDMLGG